MALNSDSRKIDDTLVIDGTIDVRKTHPNLYRMIMLLGGTCLLLGLNFLVLNPTFLIFNLPNQIWGISFLLIGTAKIVFLNISRKLVLVRLAMSFAVIYYMLLAIGTSQPFLEGTGSLQLPILYTCIAFIQFVLLLEPFINPWTARRDP